MSALAEEVLAIEVRNAVKYFPVKSGGTKAYVHSVDDVSLSVRAGQVLGVVGESGSGKSTLARVILGLITPGSGEVRVAGVSTTKMTDAEHKALTRTAQLIFQDPHASMDPRMTLGDSLTNVLAQHRIGTKTSRRASAAAALVEVGLDDSFLDRYPGGCSGGQLQRVVIARALLLQPSVLICDEPTSALDASVQASVLNLLAQLRRDRELTMLVISHDLRVIRYVSDRVTVLYCGQIVETADQETLFEAALHPYTLALIAASSGPEAGQHPAMTVRGEPPSPVAPPSGCRFHTRCPMAVERCKVELPPLVDAAPGHEVRCHRWTEVEQLRRTPR